MKELQELVQTFCTSCIVGGMVLRLFSGSASKKCIKAVVGLYILATLVRPLQQITLPVPELPKAEAYSTASGRDDFEQTVLGRGKDALEQHAEQTLRERGIDVDVSLTLQSGPAGVYVERILVAGAAPQQQAAAAECLQLLLEPGSILFEENG